MLRGPGLPACGPSALWPGIRAWAQTLLSLGDQSSRQPQDRPPPPNAARRGGSPRRFLTKSSSFILRSGLTLGLYMSVLSRMMAKARMKMVSGFRNCRTTPGLQTQYRWLGRVGGAGLQPGQASPPLTHQQPQTPEAGHPSQRLCVCLEYTAGTPDQRSWPCPSACLLAK